MAEFFMLVITIFRYLYLFYWTLPHKVKHEHPFSRMRKYYWRSTEHTLGHDAVSARNRKLVHQSQEEESCMQSSGTEILPITNIILIIMMNSFEYLMTLRTFRNMHPIPSNIPNNYLANRCYTNIVLSL